MRIKLLSSRKKTFTLIELILTIIIAGVVMLGVGAGSLFFIHQVRANRERYNMWSQISHTFDDMRMRCISAVAVATPVPVGGGSLIDSANGFIFFGEADIYDVTPEDLEDNVWYRYIIDPEGNLVLEEDPDFVGGVFVPRPERTVVLIEAEYSPRLIFHHLVFQEPNFLLADIRTTAEVGNQELEIVRHESVRFWFVDAVE